MDALQYLASDRHWLSHSVLERMASQSTDKYLPEYSSATDSGFNSLATSLRAKCPRQVFNTTPNETYQSTTGNY